MRKLLHNNLAKPLSWFAPSPDLRHSRRLENRGHILQDNLVANIEEITAFMTNEFPQFKCTIETVGNGGATVIRQIGSEKLSPDGTVSRTMLVGVADETLYVAIFGGIDSVPLIVTTNLTIIFFANRQIAGKSKAYASA